MPYVVFYENGEAVPLLCVTWQTAMARLDEMFRMPDSKLFRGDMTYAEAYHIASLLESFLELGLVKARGFIDEMIEDRIARGISTDVGDAVSVLVVPVPTASEKMVAEDYAVGATGEKKSQW